MKTLNLQEAAALLKLHPTTLAAKARAGEIPGARLGKRWVFVEVDLLDYVRSQYAPRALQGDSMEVSTCHSTTQRLTELVGQDHPRRRMPTAKHWDCRSKAGPGVSRQAEGFDVGTGEAGCKAQGLLE